MTPAGRLRLEPRTVLSEFRDGAVLLDLRTKRYFVLNRTGGVVCKRLGPGASVEELVSEICRLFEVGQADADRDVRALLADLGSESLLCPT